MPGPAVLCPAARDAWRRQNDGVAGMEDYYGIIEFTLLELVVLGWAAWQVISLRRDKKRMDAEKQRGEK